MRIYEEYTSTQEKRHAQKGAKRGKITHLARGYLLVFTEDAGTGYNYDGFGELSARIQPGDSPCAIVSIMVHPNYLSKQCRLVGWESIPKEWKVAFARRLDGCLYEEDSPGCRKRYAKILKYA